VFMPYDDGSDTCSVVAGGHHDCVYNGHAAISCVVATEFAAHCATTHSRKWVMATFR